MVKLLKFFAYITFFIFALIYFMPKDSLYYYGEHELKKYKIIVSNEEVKNNALSLKINHSKLYYDSIESAEIKSIDITLLGLYNLIMIKGIKLSTVASNFIPLKIDSVEIKYSILNPLHVLLNANGEFGVAVAEFNISDSNLSVVVKPSTLMLKQYGNSIRELHRNHKGEYEYVKNF